jgi:hypothetical protein
MEPVSRRKLLAAGSGVALASALVSASAASAQQITQPPGTPKLDWLDRYVLSVSQTASDFIRQPSTPNQFVNGPAYFTGSLWDPRDVGTDGTPAAGAMQKGSFRAFAWIYVAGTPIPQFVGVHTYDFFGLGQVIASGVTDNSVAVTGGTGTFRDARGEIRVASANSAGTLIALEFDLLPGSWGR